MSKFILLGLDGACPDIISKAIEDGLMPNFKRLKEMGCYADNVPFPSAVTPGNWTSIATGSKPTTHGISDFTMHTLGEPLDERHEVFSKVRNNRAEFVWDAYSDRGYKAAVVSFPGGLPQTKPNHLAIGNYGMPGENSDPYTIAPSRALVAGALSPVGPYNWREHEAANLRPADEDPSIDGFIPKYSLDISIGATNPGYSGEHPLRLYLGVHNGKESGILIDGPRKLLVGKREWTPFIERRFARDNGTFQKWHLNPLDGDTVVGEFRMRIVEADLERGDLLLYISPIYPKYFFSSNPEISRDLRERFGHYDDNLGISRLLMEWIDDKGFRDEFRLQGVWQARAATYLVNELNYKAVITKWHAFDKFYHFFMQKIDPAALSYDPSQFERYENLHNMVLGIADEMVGIVLDGLREDTSLVVVSDHGLMPSRRAVWVNRFLAKHGYISYTKDGRGNVAIDWSRTRAYVSCYLILNINLKGRDPQGIVEPGEEYQRIKGELIELLRDLKDPKTGQHVMSDVFSPKEDGAFYGLGSDLDGDIRYFTSPGYTLYRSTAVDGDEIVTDAVGPYLGDHGSCRPTTRFGRGSEIGIFYAAGKGFRKGYRRKFPIFPCDIIPTLLFIAGEPPLKHQEGAILYDLLEERK
ncbi:MAG: alkaline phosphatase family protein [bacterium]